MKRILPYLLFTFCIGLHSQIPNYVPDSGLIGWWPFNGNAKDESGNNNNGVNYGAVLDTGHLGDPNSAYFFNGSDTIVVPRRNLDSFTVSLWFKTNQNYIVTPFIDAYKENWELYLNKFNPTFTKWISGPGYYDEYISSFKCSSNQWNHMICIYSNGTIKLLINNQLCLSKSVSGNLIKTSGSYHFGASISGTNQYYTGSLDDIGIWNRVLTQCEISQLYNSKKNSLYSGSQIVVQKCDYDSLILQGKSGYENYTWNDGHSGVNNTIYQSGQYLLTMTDSNGCEATDTFQVSLISSNVNLEDTTICSNTSVDLAATGSIQTSACLKPAGTLVKGLVGWWPFCGNASDNSGQGNHGIVHGAQLTSDRYGMSNSAYSFNGNSDFIEANNALYDSKDSFSVSTWFYLNDLNPPTSQWNQQQYDFVSFWRSGCGQFILRFDNVPNKNSIVVNTHGECSSSFDKTKEWHFVSVTTNNFETNLYVDGLLVDKSTNQQSINICNAALNFGRQENYSGTGYLNGKLDDIGLWNRVLTPQEIWDLYTMNDPQNLSVEWSTGDTSQSITVRPSVETSYWVKTTDGIGTCYDTCTIHVSQPMANLMGDSVSCYGYSDGSAMANPSGGINPYTYKWSTGDTMNQIQNLQPGKYSVVILDSIGCADTQSIHIGEPAPIIVEINEPLRTLKDLPISITSSISPIGSYQYAWSPSSLFGSQSNLESPSIQAKSGSQIILKVVDKNGCEGSDTATLEVLQGAGVIFPNSFSPNDDGMNDSFKPHPYFDLLELKIYNAWGQCIYQSNGSKGGWDGTFAGEKVPAGAYVYQMQVQLIGTNQIINQSGSVTLVR